jgi:hypothetical protein
MLRVIMQFRISFSVVLSVVVLYVMAPYEGSFTLAIMFAILQIPVRLLLFKVKN